MGKLKDNQIDKAPLTVLYGIESSSPTDKMIVCKSNSLLSLPRTSLRLMELKLFDIYLARINPQDPSITRVVFTKKELCEILGVVAISNEELDSYLYNLATYGVRIHHYVDGSPVKDIITLFSRARITYKDKHYKDICSIELKCSEDAKKYIYNVETVGYLRMNLAKVLSFDGRNPYALYQYLSQNVFRGHWEESIDDLKEFLGLGDKYKDIKDFERRVLRPSKKEIETKTDLKFEYKKIRVGRRIGKIAFQIVKNQEPIDEPELEDDDDLALPFSKPGEYIGLGRYRFDDEYPFN